MKLAWKTFAIALVKFLRRRKKLNSAAERISMRFPVFKTTTTMVTNPALKFRGCLIIVANHGLPNIGCIEFVMYSMATILFMATAMARMKIKAKLEAGMYWPQWDYSTCRE